MKRKIILTLALVSLLVCALAFSVGAITLQESIDTYEGYFDGKTVESIDSISASEHINPKIYASYASTAVNARVELSCSCQKSHVYPTYYITKFYDADTKWGHDNCTLYGNEIFNVSFDDINAKNPCGAEYDKNSVVAIEIPNGYKVIDGGCTQSGCQSYMAGLRDSTSLKFVDTTTCTTATRLDDTSHHEAFGNCYALEYFKLSDSITEIGGWAFDECGALKRVVISENSQLKIIKTKSFFACTSLEAFYLPEGFETLTGKSSSNEAAFVRCTSLYFVSEPNELTKSDVYYFPSSLKTVEYEAFKNCNSINKCLVFGENVTKITGSWTFATNNEGIARTPETAITVVFLGKMTDFAFSNEMNYVSVVFANPNQGDITYTINGNGNYTNTGAYMYRCVDGTRSPLARQYSYTSDGFAHLAEARSVNIEYDSYLENGRVYDRCFCGESFLSSEVAEPLFTSKGFSVPKDDSNGISIGYTVNAGAIAKYTKITEKTVNYGVFASLKQNIQNKDVYGEDGSLQAGVIAADITDSGFDIFNLKIVGFADNQKEAPLAMGAFVKATDKNGAVEYSYLQGGTPNDGEKYFFASYNDALALVPSDEEDAQ